MGARYKHISNVPYGQTEMKPTPPPQLQKCNNVGVRSLGVRPKNLKKGGGDWLHLCLSVWYI